MAFSKRHDTAKSSIYKSVLVTIRIAIDLSVVLRINFKMFGMPSMGTVNSFVITSILQNISIFELSLFSKHNSINFYIVSESMTTRILRVKNKIL